MAWQAPNGAKQMNEKMDKWLVDGFLSRIRLVYLTFVVLVASVCALVTKTTFDKVPVGVVEFIFGNIGEILAFVSVLAAIVLIFHPHREKYDRAEASLLDNISTTMTLEYLVHSGLCVLAWGSWVYSNGNDVFLYSAVVLFLLFLTRWPFKGRMLKKVEETICKSGCSNGEYSIPVAAREPEKVADECIRTVEEVPSTKTLPQSKNRRRKKKKIEYTTKSIWVVITSVGHNKRMVAKALASSANIVLETAMMQCDDVPFAFRCDSSERAASIGTAVKEAGGEVEILD